MDILKEAQKINHVAGKARRARQKTKWRFDATNPVVRIFPVRENARFTHVMTNFGCDVRGKRFSTHAAVDEQKNGDHF